ncbi:LysR family transcriptional regulator [Epibacterium ulvae]|uniref:LysR family transcriptional regulator n=1 Tax=Epibacterium ulvae TaxID=1156985 RepID=UPI002493267F|nr:LysR family transcriptional regulator [Epibacterium ulvae]
MSDNFSTLRLFSRVARTGNFTAAGKETGKSQPSVSRIISNLEKDLGVQLFVRSTHAVRLTEAGEEYLTRIEPILSDIEEANHFVRGTGELRGRLRVGASASFAQREIIPTLPPFLERHPKLKVDLVLTDSMQDLIDEAIDVAIRFGPLEDSTMVARKLGTTPRLVVAAPSYLEKAGIPKQPTDLVDFQVILGPSSIGKAGWSFEKDGKVQSIRVESQLMISVNESTTTAAIAGLGVVSTAYWSCRKELEAGTLVQLLPDWTIGTVDVHALLAGGRNTKPSARAFTKHLQEALA